MEFVSDDDTETLEQLVLATIQSGCPSTRNWKRKYGGMQAPWPVPVSEHT